MNSIVINEEQLKIKKIFLDLFYTTYKKCNYNYDQTLTIITAILCNNSGQLHGLGKTITMYLLTKSIEINHYREQVGIMNTNQNQNMNILRNTVDNTLYITPDDLERIINDAIYYMISTNKTFQQDVIKSTLETGLNKGLYNISPLLFYDHMNTLLEEQTGKEALLASFEEAFTITFDRREFLAYRSPNPKSKEEFSKRKPYPKDFVLDMANLIDEDNDDKIMMCEIIYTVLIKQEAAANLSFTEYNLLNKLRRCKKTKDTLIEFFDKHRLEITSFFVRNIDSYKSWKEEGLLEEQTEFYDDQKK